MIGNLSATNAPHLVFIMDPVAQASYQLNLTDKTAQKMPAPPFNVPDTAMAKEKLFFQMRPQVSVSTGGPVRIPPLAPMPEMPVMVLYSKDGCLQERCCEHNHGGAGLANDGGFAGEWNAHDARDSNGADRQ